MRLVHLPRCEGRAVSAVSTSDTHTLMISITTRGTFPPGPLGDPFRPAQRQPSGCPLVPHPRFPSEYGTPMYFSSEFITHKEEGFYVTGFLVNTEMPSLPLVLTCGREDTYLQKDTCLVLGKSFCQRVTACRGWGVHRNRRPALSSALGSVASSPGQCH